MAFRWFHPLLSTTRHLDEGVATLAGQGRSERTRVAGTLMTRVVALVLSAGQHPATHQSARRAGAIATLLLAHMHSAVLHPGTLHLTHTLPATRHLLLLATTATTTLYHLFALITGSCVTKVRTRVGAAR